MYSIQRFIVFGQMPPPTQLDIDTSYFDLDPSYLDPRVISLNPRYIRMVWTGHADVVIEECATWETQAGHYSDEDNAIDKRRRTRLLTCTLCHVSNISDVGNKTHCCGVFHLQPLMTG